MTAPAPAPAADDPLAAEIDAACCRLLTDFAERALTGDAARDHQMIASLFTGAFSSAIHFFWRFKEASVTTDMALDAIRAAAATLAPQIEARLAGERGQAEPGDAESPPQPVPPAPGEPGWLLLKIRELIYGAGAQGRDGMTYVDGPLVLSELAYVAGGLLASGPDRLVRRTMRASFDDAVSSAQRRALATGDHPAAHVTPKGHA